MDTKEFTFIIPNTSWFGKRYWHNHPYTEALLAAVLAEGGYNVNIIDANIYDYSETDLEDIIRKEKPKIIGIGMMALEYRDCAHKSFEIVKKVDPSIITIFGGIYPTLSPEMATKDRNIDYVVMGEGEKRLIALLQKLERGETLEDVDGLAYWKDGILKINERDLHNLVDLNSLPLPDYSKFNMPKYMNFGQKFTQNFQFKQFPVMVTMTSRGCPFSCSFCSIIELFQSNLRTMSSKRVLAEVDMLINDFGAREIIFQDDSLLFPKDRAIEIMDGLIERRKQGKDIVWKSNNLAIHHMKDELVLDKMKESGCYQVIVSIESGSPATLKRMRKPVNLKEAIRTLEKIQKRGFDDVSSNFVIGMPGDTWDDIRESFQFADDMVSRGLLDYVVFHIATPLPKTELYEECKKGKYIPDDFDFENQKYYGFGKGVITTEEFTPDELQIVRAFEWDRINFKTREKKEKIIKMLGITMEELEIWRKETRRSIGLHVRSADKRA